jgi:hypothetical protein
MVGPLAPTPPGVGQLLQSLVSPAGSGDRAPVLRPYAQASDRQAPGGFADRLGDALDLSPDARRALDGLGDLDRLIPGGRQVVDSILSTIDRLTRDLFGGGSAGSDRTRGQFLDQLKDAVGGSPTFAAAGGQFLSFQGFELKVSRTDGGIDISFDRVSVQAASAFGVAAGDAGVAAYAGFAAQISTLSVDIHIDTGGGSLPKPAPLAAPIGPPPPFGFGGPLVFDLLGPDDPRRKDETGRPRSDDGFFKNVGEVLRNLREVVDRLRALAADLREDDGRDEGARADDAPADGAKAGASDASPNEGLGKPSSPSALPGVLLIRETEFEASQLTRLRFDFHQPLPNPGPAGPAAGSGGVALTA